MTGLFEDFEQPNGKIEIKGGDTYWMGSKVKPCSKCGVSPTNVDDCGEFGNPDCPYFGIGQEEYDRRYNNKNEK